VGASSSLEKAAVLRHGGGVAGAVQDANDHEFSFIVEVVDGVIAGEAYAQTRGKLSARGPSKREAAQRFAIPPDLSIRRVAVACEASRAT
jgi:hypothetical protein